MTSATLHITETAAGDPARYRVEIRDGARTSRHDVTITGADAARLFGAADPVRGLEATFRFLLEREPADAILRSFDLAVVERYFPDFPSVIGRTLGAPA